MGTRDRVLVVGLDGADFGMVSRLASEGKLPNLQRLIDEGSFGPLKSTMPPVTPCAWTSFATGKDPSKHGLFDFKLHEGDPEKKKSANRTFVTARSLWGLLTAAGKMNIVVDVPLTYPPEEISGIMVSRVMAPPGKNCTYPKSLHRTLRRKGYLKEPVRKLAEEHGADKANREETRKKRRRASKAKQRKMARERKEKAFKHMCEEIDKNIELARWLMKRQEWDFFMMVFMSADHAGHSFWSDQARVKKIYAKLDAAVGELCELAGEDTVKFVMSDHGFTSVPYSFNVNEWLHTKGLLAKKLDLPVEDSVKELRELMKELRTQAPGSGLKTRHRKLTRFRYTISTDYSRSKAYLQSGTSYGVRINLEGRDTTGVVKREEYEAFRDYLMEELEKLKHPRTGRNLFSQVLRKEDVYAPSPFGMDPAPDIFLLTPDMEVMVQGQFREVKKIFGKTRRGYGFHHTDGIVFAQGDGIAHAAPGGATITDLAPTILHVLGVPLPDDLDGRVLKEVFRPGSRYAEREIRYQGASAISADKATYSEEEEAKIRERLKALGYVE